MLHMSALGAIRKKGELQDYYKRKVCGSKKQALTTPTYPADFEPLIYAFYLHAYK